MQNVSVQKHARSSASQDAILARRAEVILLRREGQTQMAIAARLGVNVATVSRDLAALREEWVARAAGEYSDHVAEQLQQLEAIRAEAWVAFRESKTRMRPEGDPRALELVRRTTADVIKLLGIDDPVAFNAKRVSGEEGTDGHVDVVEIAVSSREELADITDDDGNISLRAFKQKMLERAPEQTPNENTEVQ